MERKLFSCLAIGKDGKKKLGMRKSEILPPAMVALEDKYLYICTDEMAESGAVRWIVHRIKMSHVLTASGFSVCRRSLEKVAEENSSSSDPFPSYPGCGVFQSKILIGGGRIQSTHSPFGPEPPSLSLFTFDPDTLKMERDRIPPFLKGKADPLLVEMNGQLYALAGDQLNYDCGGPFEKFDGNQWQQLNSPPFWDENSPYYKSSQGASFVITDTSFLVSRRETPVFKYDVTNPEGRWSVPLSLCDGRCFPFEAPTLVHPCASGGFIIFAFDTERVRDTNYGPLPPTRLPRILVYHMSQNYDALVLLETMDLEVPLEDHLLLKFGRPLMYDTKFVPLEGQRVCLVISSFGTAGGAGVAAKEDNLSFLVRTFAYKVEIPTFSYKYLGKPVILKHIIEREPGTVTRYGGMMGAFVL